MAARVRKVRHDENTRAKIQTSQLINRLYGHVVGKVELSPTQVRAAEVLLRKTLPDLSATEIDAKVRNVNANELADDELATIATGSGAGTTKAPVDPSQLN